MNRFLKIIFFLLLPFLIFSATLSETSGPTNGNTTVYILAGSSQTFGASPIIKIGGQEAILISSTNTFIEIKTPEGIGVNLVVLISWVGGSIIAEDQFSYESPDLSSISPEDFFARGGELATLTGTNLGTLELGETEIKIGDNFAKIVSQTHEEITFRMPTGSGTNKIVTVNVGGQLSDSLQINYFPPSIWQITPYEITANEGDTLYICGVNFGNGETLPIVKLGGIVCKETVYAGDDKLYIVTNHGEPQNLDVCVEYDGQMSNTYSLKKRKPEITNVLQETWDPAGGESITLFGKYFGEDESQISLEINGRNIPTFLLSGSSITFSSIPGIGKDLPLIVKTYGVESDAYHISFEQSTLSSISPDTGNTIGGVQATISGIGIGLGDILPLIYFGENLATNVTSINDNQLSATIPAGVGQVEVFLDLNGVTSNSILFDYTSPTLFNVIPAIVPLSGGEIILSGIELGNQLSDAVVLLDGEELNPSEVNFSLIKVDIPGGSGQNKLIQVKVGDVLSNTLNYSYVSPTITGVSPSIGKAGAVLVIQGLNLGGNTLQSTVTIGGNSAGILTSSANQIRCIIPSGSGTDQVVSVSLGNTSDNFIGFSYDETTPNNENKVEVIGKLQITEIPYKESNGVQLSVDNQGNIIKSPNPQIFVSPSNDTLFLGENQFIIIPGISQANGGG